MLCYYSLRLRFFFFFRSETLTVDFDSLEGIVSVGKQDGTKAFAPVIGGERDIGPEDGSGLPEEVLEVLPSHPEGQVVHK